MNRRTNHNLTSDRRKTVIMADIGLLFVALFWGGGFVAGKFALEGFTPMNLLALRYLGAALILFFLCIRRLKNFSKELLRWGVFNGLLVFIGNVLQTVGLQYTTPGKQSFIISLYVVLVPLFSWIAFKIRPGKRIIIAAFLALIGISLLTLKDDLTVNPGDFMTFLFAVAFSIQVIITGRHINRVDAPLFTLVQVSTAAACSLVAALILGDPIEPVQFTATSTPAILYLMTFNSAFAFALQNLSQRHAPADHTAILLSMETVFGTIFAITLAGEIFSGRMIPGCILMFVAIATAEFPSQKKPSGPEKQLHDNMDKKQAARDNEEASNTDNTE